MRPSVRRVAKRVVKNARAFLLTDIHTTLLDQSQQLSRLSQQVSVLSNENVFLLRTCFEQDPWLAKAKDIHKGERCFLLGCGPSLNDLDLSRLQGEHTMGVNGTCLIESLNLEYFITVSHIWWKHHVQALRSLRCKRRFLPTYLRELASDCPTSWLRVIEYKDHQRVEESRPWFFSTHADRYVVSGGTVLFVGLQVLYHLGFSEVILLGVDHDYGIKKEDVGKSGIMVPAETLNAHFIPDYYPLGGSAHIDLWGMERAYELAKEAFENDGRVILNASPGSKLTTYPFVEYDSLFHSP